MVDGGGRRQGEAVFLLVDPSCLYEVSLVPMFVVSSSSDSV